VQSSSHHRFATLVEPHLEALCSYVERRDPALVDDVMSEVGVVAWRRLDDLPRGHERAWLFGVVRMVLMAERRKAAARQASELVGDAALDTLPAPVALAPSLAPPLAEALATLPERDRELLLLTAWEGLSTGEAAEAIGVRATAARMALVRARRRLAAALDHLDPGWDGNRPPRTAQDPRKPEPLEASS
jgi:RNA polymerase sigma-70 factor (ECF subfamily)